MTSAALAARATVGARIFDYMALRSMTQEKLAALCSYSRPFISKLINGKQQRANVDNIANIAAALKVTIADLFLPSIEVTQVRERVTQYGPASAIAGLEAALDKRADRYAGQPRLVLYLQRQIAALAPGFAKVTLDDKTMDGLLDGLVVAFGKEDSSPTGKARTIAARGKEKARKQIGSDTADVSTQKRPG